MAHELKKVWEHSFDKILSATAQHISDLDHEKFCGLTNERFYHHQFSCLLWEHFKGKKRDMWASHLLTPEGKTKGEFNWDALDLKDVEGTRAKTLKGRQRGNYDFVINTETPVMVEWKGPRMYQKKEIAKVCLKLLHDVNPDEPKLVCTILTSAKKGNRTHVEVLEERFKLMLRFACKVVGCDDIASRNLFVYVATILDGKAYKYHWGQLTDIDAKWNPI